MIPLADKSYPNGISVTPHNGFTNGNYSKIIANSKSQRNGGLPANVTLVPAAATNQQRSEKSGEYQFAPMNLSNKKKQLGEKQIQRQNVRTKVSNIEEDKAVGKTKKVTKDVQTKRNDIRKEIYDYTLEDIIRFVRCFYLKLLINISIIFL